MVRGYQTGKLEKLIDVKVMLINVKAMLIDVERMLINVKVMLIDVGRMLINVEMVLINVEVCEPRCNRIVQLCDVSLPVAWSRALVDMVL